VQHLQTRGYARGTIKAYQLELEAFRQFLRKRKLRVNQVKPRDIEQFLRERDSEGLHQPTTVRRRLAALSAFYSFLAVMANGQIRNPVDPLRRPRRQPPRPKPLNENQISALMEGIDDPRDVAIIAVLLHSGLRLNELCSLNRDSIRVEHLGGALSSKVIGVGRVLGKGSKEREFLIDLGTLKLVHRYLTERGADDQDALFLSNRRRRINPRTVQHMLHAWCRKLGLPPLHPHQLRSTFGTRLNRVGVPTLEISKLLGHASLDTTMQYIKPDVRRIQTEYFAAYEKLNPA